MCYNAFVMNPFCGVYYFFVFMFIILIIAVTGFFVITSLVAFGLWHSYREEHILGSLIFLWSVVAIFLLVVFFAERNFKAAKSAQAASGNGPPAAQPLYFPEL